MRKKISLILFAWFFQIHFASAQTHTIDSLQLALKNAKQDTTRSILLSEICHFYSYTNPDTALAFGQQGLIVARSAGFARGEVNCLISIASVFSDMGNDAKALELNLQALKKVDDFTDAKFRYNILIGITTAYWDQQDYENALKYAQQAETIAYTVADTSYLANSLINIGDVYEKLNQLDSARFCDEQGYDLAVKTKDDQSTGGALNNLGNTYAKMQQPEMAMANYKMSIPYERKAAVPEGICESTLGIAKLFQQKGQDDSSFYYAKISLTTAEENHLLQYVLNASNFLAGYYKQHHGVDSAYAYLSMVIAAKDTINSQEKIRQVQSLSFDETMRQQEIAADKITALREHENNLQLLGITIGIIVLIILFLLFSQTFIVHERWIKFLGIMGLLIIFEYIYLFIDPYVLKITNESPAWLMVVLVLIAVILEPLHNRIEHWITHKVVMKNKRLRLAAAKKTVERLEAESKGGE